jgi:hypothetical protein
VLTKNGLKELRDVPPLRAGEPAWGTRNVFNLKSLKVATAELPLATRAFRTSLSFVNEIGLDSLASSTTGVAEDVWNMLNAIAVASGSVGASRKEALVVGEGL